MYCIAAALARSTYRTAGRLPPQPVLQRCAEPIGRRILHVDAAFSPSASATRLDTRAPRSRARLPIDDGVTHPRAIAVRIPWTTCSGAAPASATSRSVRSGVVRRTPSRMVTSSSPRGSIVVWSVTPTGGWSPRRARGTVTWMDRGMMRAHHARVGRKDFMIGRSDESPSVYRVVNRGNKENQTRPKRVQTRRDRPLFGDKTRYPNPSNRRKTMQNDSQEHSRRGLIIPRLRVRIPLGPPVKGGLPWQLR